MEPRRLIGTSADPDTGSAFAAQTRRLDDPQNVASAWCIVLVAFSRMPLPLTAVANRLCR
eukprot:10235900-Alexandrium_andersonii.AAC.1